MVEDHARYMRNGRDLRVLAGATCRVAHSLVVCEAVTLQTAHALPRTEPYAAVPCRQHRSRVRIGKALSCGYGRNADVVEAVEAILSADPDISLPILIERTRDVA